MSSLNEDVSLVISTLLNYGVLSESGCRKFADFIRNLQSLTGFSAADAAALNGRRKKGPKVQRRKPGRKERRGRKRAKIDLDKLRELYKTKSAKEIAAHFGTSSATIYNYVSKNKIKKEKPKA